MNISASECNSGCESGWTMYLDQSSNYSQQNHILYHKNGTTTISGGDFVTYNMNTNKSSGVNYMDGCDEGDEDLSMVSDASSGPPHFDDHEGCCFDENARYNFCSVSDHEQTNNKKKKKNKIKEKGTHGKKEQNLYLDDTASSPIKNHMVVPQHGGAMEHGTDYKGKSASQKHIGFFQSHMSKKSGSGAAGGFQGRKWE